jgi:hypothetical protein
MNSGSRPVTLERKMAIVTDEKIEQVATTLWRDLYEDSFRGKERGRFCVTRGQLKEALDTERLHASTIQRLQDAALALGLVIIDLDDLFPCIEVRIVRKYRRPPSEIFLKHFPAIDEVPVIESEDDDE